jgi:tRNA G10  N-methylase Trm11
VVANIRNSPWIGDFDAIITDPPYNMRTALIAMSSNNSSNRNSDGNDSNDNNNSSNNNDSRDDRGDICDMRNVGRRSNDNNHNKDNDDSNDKDINNVINDYASASKSPIDINTDSILSDLISSASDHLSPGGRLAFWWPQGTYTYVCMYMYLFMYE